MYKPPLTDITLSRLKNKTKERMLDFLNIYNVDEVEKFMGYKSSMSEYAISLSDELHETHDDDLPASTILPLIKMGKKYKGNSRETKWILFGDLPIHPRIIEEIGKYPVKHYNRIQGFVKAHDKQKHVYHVTGNVFDTNTEMFFHLVCEIIYPISPLKQYSNTALLCLCHTLKIGENPHLIRETFYEPDEFHSNFMKRLTNTKDIKRFLHERGIFSDIQHDPRYDCFVGNFIELELYREVVPDKKYFEEEVNGTCEIYMESIFSTLPDLELIKVYGGKPTRRSIMLQNALNYKMGLK